MDFSAFLAFDKAIFLWVEKIFDYGISAILTPILVFLTNIGEDGIVWVVLALILMCFKKTRKIGFTMAAAGALVVVCNNLLMKSCFDRVRPFNLEIWRDWFVYPEFVSRPDSFSFPSGHASSSFAAATALTCSKKARYIVPAFIMAALISFSRVYLHVHYPTDILFGALFGVLYGIIAIVVCKYIIQFVNEKTKLTVFRD